MKRKIRAYYDSKCKRYRINGKFVSKQHFFQYLFEEKRKSYAVKSKSGKFYYLPIKKRKKKRYIRFSKMRRLKDGKLYKFRGKWRCPYRIMEDGRINISEIERFENDSEKTISYPTNPKCDFYNIRLFIDTNRGMGWVSTGYVEKDFLLQSLGDLIMEIATVDYIQFIVILGVNYEGVKYATSEKKIQISV